MTLEIGNKAPDFTLPGGGGQTISLGDFKGKNIVVYFYPKDSTPGCTVEAKDFTTAKNDFEAANTVVIGMSKDSVKRHDNFIEKQELDVLLASDEDGAIIVAYGVWQEKHNYGKVYMGIVRSTFLIDSNGIIKNIWSKVRVKGHVDAVLEAARGL